MAAQTQAQCLLAPEQLDAIETAARASILAAFTSAQGYSGDADYSPRAWLINNEPDSDPDGEFDYRSVRLETTFQGAGVLNGDLTPECAAAVTAVLDALSAPAAPRTPGPVSSGTTTRYTVTIWIPHAWSPQ